MQLGGSDSPDSVKLIPKFKVENITVARAPLLKVYYWECFDIDGLNAKLETEERQLHHSMHIPTSQINSRPFKVILWLRNCSDQNMDLRLRRIKNCDCVPLQTRVGFNQFRQLYHCPHRRLIHILQEYIYMKPDDLVALSVISYFILFGEHKLTFEMTGPDSRMLTLDFRLDIIGFDPQKCLLTKELLPSDINEFRRYVQPIWVRNITMQHINFIYSTHGRGLKLINPNLTVPRQSVWPLMVEYRPSDYVNDLELIVNFNSVRLKSIIKARGRTEPEPPDPYVPIEDNDSTDFLYVIYPNKLEFEVELREERSLMVCIRNYNQKCMEFRWQNYVINDLFEITFEPANFRLKQHHSKLCVVQLHVHQRPLYFKRIPAVLEVHRIFNKSTRIAKELLEEVESIDDPKWAEDSYIEHVFLHLNVKVNFKTEPIVEPHWEMPINVKNERKRTSSTKHGLTTIFEKLFWEYLSRSRFMRENKEPEVSDDLDYNQVLTMLTRQLETTKSVTVSKNEILKMLSQLLAEGLRELSKNWRFVPHELCV